MRPTSARDSGYGRLLTDEWVISTANPISSPLGGPVASTHVHPSGSRLLFRGKMLKESQIAAVSTPTVYSSGCAYHVGEALLMTEFRC